MGLGRAANENQLAGFGCIARLHAVDRTTSEDEIFMARFFWEIVRRRDTKIEAPQWQARAHEHDALGLVFSRKKEQGKMRGMTRSDDEIGRWEICTLRQCASNAAENPTLPRDRNAVNVTCHKPLYRLGEAKRLVFMAGLAVTDQPKSE